MYIGTKQDLIQGEFDTIKYFYEHIHHIFLDINSLVQFFHVFSTISVLSLGKFWCRWCVQCSWHSRLNHARMDLDVSYPPSGWSPLLISLGRICFIHFYSFGWSLLICFFIWCTRLLVAPPTSWPFRLTQQWLGVHNLIPHPPLWFVSWFTVPTLNFHYYTKL